MNQASPLSDKTILITRPIGREIHLRHLIEQAGGTVVHYPVFTIQKPSTTEVEKLAHLQAQLNNFNMAIFISPTAVEQSQIYFPTISNHLSIVSIGSKTTRALEKQNLNVDIEAPEHTTESLLLSPQLQTKNVEGKNILIFRGYGGRALLGETLINRGANISYAETYRRELPQIPPLCEQQITALDAITISSNDGLNNLVTLMSGSSLLLEAPIIVPGKRTFQLAKTLNFKKIITANDATDEAIITALMADLARS